MAAGMARRALDGLDVHLTAEMLASVRLLVTELVTNSLRHAGMDEEDQVVLAVCVTDEDVRVEVGDPGGGFEPQTDRGALEREDGWGLYLVDRLADRWGVTREPQTTVWLEMDLKPLAATADTPAASQAGSSSTRSKRSASPVISKTRCTARGPLTTRNA